MNNKPRLSRRPIRPGDLGAEDGRHIQRKLGSFKWYDLAETIPPGPSTCTEIIARLPLNLGLGDARDAIARTCSVHYWTFHHGHPLKLTFDEQDNLGDEHDYAD